MDFTFSLGWFFAGIVILTAGGLVVLFYRQIANHLAIGISYDKIKLYGIIAIIIGFLITANLHTFVLQFIVNLLFKR